MGDMSRCKHGRAIGYCDDCSPNWEMDLIKGEAYDNIFEKGVAHGLNSRGALLAFIEQVRQHERKACAKMLRDTTSDMPNGLVHVTITTCAEAVETRETSEEERSLTVF